MKQRTEDPSEDTQRRAMKRRRTSLSIPGQQAGKQSGRVRAARSDFRRRIIAMVFEELKPAYRNQPFSTQALDVLRDEYLKVLNREEDNVFRRLLRDRLRDNGENGPDLDALVKSVRPGSSQQIIAKSRPALDKPAPARDNKVLLHWALERDISNLSDNDRQFLKEVSHDTLLKDLKELGIRSRRRQTLLENRDDSLSNNHLRRVMFLLIQYRLVTHHLVQAEEAGDKLTDEERRIRFIRTAELYRDQYLKLLHPKRNKSLRAKYMKLIDQIQDGGDEMRRHFQWTMRTLDQLPAADRKVMSEISCETFFSDADHAGLLIKRKQKRSG
jgi:hypothetical protein